MGSVGPTELLMIALVVVLIFGAGRIAEIGKGLGEGIRNFKKGLKDEPGDEPAQLPKRGAAGEKEDDDEEAEDDEERSRKAKVQNVVKKSEKKSSTDEDE